MRVIVSVFNNLITDQRVEKVCKTLSENRYQIELIGNNWGGSPVLNRNYPVTRLSLNSKILRYAYVEFQWKLYRHLLKTADNNCILLANDLDSLLPNYLIAKKFKIPLVFDSHEIFTEMPALQGRFTQKIWRSLEKNLVPKLEYMMTASQSYAEWFAQTYQILPPVVLQNFPRKLQTQKIQEENNPKIILYQGVINPARGLEKISPALHNIPNAVLWIVGEGPRTEEYRTLTAQLNLQKKVRFFGKLLPDELRLLTQQADVGLSIEENKGLSYYYSLPNKVSDYVQARVPLVVSNFPEMVKIIDRFPVGEKTTDHADLAEKVNIVLNNGKIFYAEALEKAAAHLCWEKEEPKLLKLFQKVTDENF